MNFIKTEPGASPIVVEASFSVPPSAVFAAWTVPERVKQWFGITPGAIDDVTIDLSVGGRWRFVEAADDNGRSGFEGIYLEIDSDRRLTFSWTKFTEPTSGERTTTKPSQVEITFAETAEGTNMRIVHSAVDAADRAFSIGWNAGVRNLVALLRVVDG